MLHASVSCEQNHLHDMSKAVIASNSRVSLSCQAVNSKSTS